MTCRVFVRVQNSDLSLYLFIFFKTGPLGSLSVLRGAVPLGKMQGEDDEERHVWALEPQMQTQRDHLWILQSQDGPHRTTGTTCYSKSPGSHKKDLKSNGKYLEIQEIFFQLSLSFFSLIGISGRLSSSMRSIPLVSVINVPWPLSFTFVQGT